MVYADRKYELDRKQKTVAYLLWCLGFLGLCGLHRLYTERYLLGLLYLFTFGFCFLGQLIDLLLIPDDVATFNHALQQRPQGAMSASVPSSASAAVRSLPASGPAADGLSPAAGGDQAGAGGDQTGELPLTGRTKALLADAQASMQRLKDQI